jgi:hypothetical protein
MGKHKVRKHAAPKRPRAPRTAEILDALRGALERGQRGKLLQDLAALLERKISSLHNSYGLSKIRRLDKFVPSYIDNIDTLITCSELSKLQGPLTAPSALEVAIGVSG